MTILWCGGEDLDFPNNSSPTVSTVSGKYRSDYARCAVSATGSSGLTSSLAFSGGAVTSAWLQARLYPTALGNTYRIFGLTNSGSGSSAKGIYLGVGSSTNKLAIFKWDGTTATKLAEESGSSYTTSLQLFTMQVSSFGASCTINVYVGGGSSPVISGTYDASISGVSNLDQVSLCNSSAGAGSVFSEIVVADEDTRSFSLCTHAPTSDGTTTDWTGAYTDVDETTISDADQVYTNSTGQDMQVNMGNLPSGTWGIKAQKIAARMAKASSTPTTVALGWNNGGTIDAGTGQSITTSWATYERLDTSPAYNQSQVDSLQINLRSG